MRIGLGLSFSHRDGTAAPAANYLVETQTFLSGTGVDFANQGGWRGLPPWNV